MALLHLLRNRNRHLLTLTQLAQVLVRDPLAQQTTSDQDCPISRQQQLDSPTIHTVFINLHQKDLLFAHQQNRSTPLLQNHIQHHLLSHKIHINLINHRQLVVTPNSQQPIAQYKKPLLMKTKAKTVQLRLFKLNLLDRITIAHLLIESHNER